MGDALLFPERLRFVQDELSASQLRVARFLLAQPQQGGSLAAVRIGQAVGVSESTVVRLALRLGYDGFPEMQDDIARSVGPDAATEKPKNVATPETIESMLATDVRNLTQTVAQLDSATIASAVDLLEEAATIYVVGFRTSFSLAYLASFLLRQLHPSTVLLDDSGGALPEGLATMKPGDVLLAVSFPRYIRKTVQAVDFAVEQGVRTIALTDSFLSPISKADVLIAVQHYSPSFFNSNVAATAVINSIAAELADRIGPASSASRRRLIESFYEMTEQPGASIPPFTGPNASRTKRTPRPRSVSGGPEA
jgi:DNA-binding MurR/RpiR family transcriptional regulator